MNNDSKIMLLMMFQLQNGHRKLSEFTGNGVFSDCFVWELELDVGVDPSLKREDSIHFFIFDYDGCVCWNVNKKAFDPFPILDYISFEDKI